MIDEKDQYDEEQLNASPHLKKLLLSEVDLIRDALSILGVFTDASLKTGLKLLEDVENDIPLKNHE
ncbi:hypothetical protein [Leadbetterella sp. DM7]|uniref:hypothetical protein n=1 Tax=Leadbetterella sp. DM7 TaxID=3235085 RepID=UPI00349EAC2B